jgi:hypothetical protein
MLRNVGALADELGDKPAAGRICAIWLCCFAMTRARQRHSAAAAVMALRRCNSAVSEGQRPVRISRRQVRLCRAVPSILGAETDRSGRTGTQPPDGRDRPAGAAVDG